MIELELAAKMVSAECDINSFMPMIQHILYTYSCENSVFIECHDNVKGTQKHSIQLDGKVSTAFISFFWDRSVSLDAT
jgi:hypothetical protein